MENFHNKTNESKTCSETPQWHLVVNLKQFSLTKTMDLSSFDVVPQYSCLAIYCSAVILSRNSAE